MHHITPIDGADRIECVHVLGWQCVANKGQFKVGDHCVYMEVDSFLPVCEQFEFLRSNSFKKNEILGEGFRLKTLNFRGQISQGLVQPLSILPEGNYELGDDVTALLGIRKWEVEERVTNSGTVIGDFPDGIPKTDELRVQPYPELIDEFKAVKGYYISTKMDGTSVTMYWRDGHFGICGRNYEYADDDKCAMWKYAHENGIPERVAESAYQQIMDLLERFQKIDAAIVAFNAATMLHTSFGDYTVAGAISLRSRMRGNGSYDDEADFEQSLFNKMKSELDKRLISIENKNKQLESTAASMRLGILGKDTKSKDISRLKW